MNCWSQRWPIRSCRSFHSHHPPYGPFHFLRTATGHDSGHSFVLARCFGLPCVQVVVAIEVSETSHPDPQPPTWDCCRGVKQAHPSRRRWSCPFPSTPRLAGLVAVLIRTDHNGRYRLSDAANTPSKVECDHTRQGKVNDHCCHLRSKGSIRRQAYLDLPSSTRIA